MMIIAGVSINTFLPDKIKKIILSGADVLRYNFSYRSNEENIEHIKIAINTVDGLNSSIKILIDLPSYKIRLGDFDIKLFAVREGSELTFQSSKYSPDCEMFLPVDTLNLGTKTYVDQTITIGDGEISIQVTEILSPTTIRAKILNTGMIQAMKGFNISKKIDEVEIIDQYKEILNNLEQNNIEPDFLALPYINPHINEQLLLQIPASCNRSKIIYKIEDRTSLDYLEQICQTPSCNMILIDRGEMGINIPFEKLGLIQKSIINIAKKYGKTVIVSTQILESTMNNYIPSRSEINDLTNIVLDGAAGIMLCKETGMGLRPAYSISVAKKIIQAVENNKYS